MTESIDFTNKLFNQGFLNLSLIQHATRWWSHSLFVLVAIAGYICTESTTLAFAQERSNSVQCPTTYSEECFSPREAWAWEQIVQGKPANMNDYPDDNQDTQPLSQDNKPRCKLLNTGEPIKQSTRTLSHKFIEFVATHKRYEQGDNKRLVHIECAVVDEQIDLSNKKIRPELIISASLLKNGIDISDAHFLRSFTIEKSLVTGTVNSAGALFDRSLSLIENRHEQVILDNAQIRANLLVKASTLTKTFSARAIDVGGDMFLFNVSFEERVNLAAAEIGKDLYITDSVFERAFRAANLDVGGDMFLFNVSFEERVNLAAAEIGKDLYITDSVFERAFRAANLDVGGDMFLFNVSFKELVYLMSAKIGKQLYIRGSVFESAFRAANLDVGDDMFLFNVSFEQQVEMIDAKIGKKLYITDSVFEGVFRAASLDASDMFLYNTTFKKTIDLRSAELGGTLRLAGSSFASTLDLSQTQIASSFVLYGKDELKDRVPLWKEGAELILNHAHAGILQASMPNSWLMHDAENRLTSTLLKRDLHGFTYDALHLIEGDEIDDERITQLIEWAGGDTTATKDHSTKKKTSVWHFLLPIEELCMCMDLGWQQGDTNYTPQPYTELAEKLREMGEVDQADLALIARFNHYYEKQRDEKQYSLLAGWLVKFINKFDCFYSGYGVDPLRPLYAFGLLVLLFTWVNFRAYKPYYKEPENSWWRVLPYYVFRPLFHSFRNSIPIPGLLSYTKKVVPYHHIHWLYCQKIIGLIVLASVGYLSI